MTKSPQASIGSEKHSEHIEGTFDCRGFDLESVADILTNCRMIIGPSSGPMHFASLCKCPQLVWTGNKNGLGRGNREKYEKKWNPFGVDVHVCEDGGWNPDVDFILEEFDKFDQALIEKEK